jgi:streptomycin 6-kinase
MKITESTRQGIMKYLGDKTEVFLSKVDMRIDKYTEKWKLSDLSFMPTDTINLLFSCESELYGSCVLKMCIPGPDAATEINCLRAYDGRAYVKLWDYSLTDDMLLLERIAPGNQMWEVTDYKERVRFMARIIKDLPFINCEQGKYPTYRTWMEGIHSTLTDMGNMEDVLFYLNEALRIYDELKQKYNRSCLLHGDMHQENLLLNNQGGYTIIDPKGVVDDPVMETARFLMNETPCETEKIQEMVAIMASTIGIPEADIIKSMYIDAALGQCWTLEEHFPTQEAFDKNKEGALETCEFVYELITKKGGTQSGKEII